NPRESHHPVHLESHRISELGRGDGVATDDLECQADVHRRGKGKARAPDHLATSSATTIPITLGPHCTKLPRNRARSVGNSSAGKIPAMKKTNAYSKARTRRRPADWLSRSTGNPDEIPRALGARASGRIRVTCSFMPKLPTGRLRPSVI